MRSYTEGGGWGGGGRADNLVSRQPMAPPRDGPAPAAAILRMRPWALPRGADKRGGEAARGGEKGERR